MACKCHTTEYASTKRQRQIWQHGRFLSTGSMVFTCSPPRCWKIRRTFISIQMRATWDAERCSAHNGCIQPGRHNCCHTIITIKELLPIVIAVEIYSQTLSNRHICFHCDNIAVVHIINKQTSKEKTVMKLFRRLVVTALKLNITLFAEHIPGKNNSLADFLSRLQVNEFQRAAPGIDEHPTPVPTRLLNV